MTDTVPLTPAEPAVVTLPAEIDVVNAEHIAAELADALIPGARVVIADLTATTFCDIAGVRTLVLARQQAAAQGIELRLRSPSPDIVRVMTLLSAGDAQAARRETERCRAARTWRQALETWQKSQEIWARSQALKNQAAVTVSSKELLTVSPLARLAARLETMPVIEQAKGILMAQSGCDADQAFDMLRRASQRSNVPVRNLAKQIVSNTQHRCPQADPIDRTDRTRPKRR